MNPAFLTLSKSRQTWNYFSSISRSESFISYPNILYNIFQYIIQNGNELKKIGQSID